MANPLVSPPDLSPPLPKSATPRQCITVWLDLMNVCEKLLLAGLRREIGPEGDLKAAHRRWYAEQMEEHDRTMLRMMAEFERRGGGRAR
jgi:hypothetical protein